MPNLTGKGTAIVKERAEMTHPTHLVKWTFLTNWTVIP